MRVSAIPYVRGRPSPDPGFAGATLSRKRERGRASLGRP
jgi:hypothetical protein